MPAIWSADLHFFGQDVAKDDRLTFVYYNCNKARNPNKGLIGKSSSYGHHPRTQRGSRSLTPGCSMTTPKHTRTHPLSKGLADECASYMTT